VDVRIQVDGEVMHAAVNLDRPPPGAPAAPVRPGALRRSVAAVLVRLAVARADPTAVGCGLYDPCCGTGTVVAEAARRGLPVYASDLDPAAVDLTRARLAAPGGEVPVLTPDVVRHRVFVHDLLRGKPQRVDSGLVASNLPWGKQVSVPRRGDLFEACAALAGRVVAGGGCCVLLTTHDEQLVARVRRHVRGADVTVRRIGLLGQTPAIVTVRPTGVPTE
jgi:tRNA G10  N-methylase Trm11